MKSELALQASEARYRAIVEHADTLIALTDADGNVAFVNKLVERTLGRTKEEIVGQPYISFYAPEEHGLVEVGFSRLKDGTEALTESRNHASPRRRTRHKHGRFSGGVTR